MFFSLHFIEQYPYRDCDISKVLLHLIHITVNTLNAQYHSCKPQATAGPLYSDNSNISRYSEKEKGTLHVSILSQTQLAYVIHFWTMFSLDRRGAPPGTILELKKKKMTYCFINSPNFP